MTKDDELFELDTSIRTMGVEIEGMRNPIKTTHYGSLSENEMTEDINLRLGINDIIALEYATEQGIQEIIKEMGHKYNFTERDEFIDKLTRLVFWNKKLMGYIKKEEKNKWN